MSAVEESLSLICRALPQISQPSNIVHCTTKALDCSDDQYEGCNELFLENKGITLWELLLECWKRVGDYL